MERNVKFTANELLDSFNREYNQNDMNEIYKALIAYSVGLTEINEESNKVLEDTLDIYFENDDIYSFINEELYNFAEENIEDIH